MKSIVKVAEEEAKATQVFIMITMGTPFEEALRINSITKHTYYRVLGQNPKLLDAIRDYLAIAQKGTIAMMTVAYQEGIRRVIENIPNLEGAALINALTWIEQRQAPLLRQFQLNPGEAPTLTSPETSLQESRFTVEVNVKEKKSNIIDA